MSTLQKLLLLGITILLTEMGWIAPCLGQTSGVLLGIAGESSTEETDTQTFGTIHAPKYRTLWVASDGKGELKVLASLPELIVPRKDGFWHIGVEQVCEFDDGSLTSSPGNESLRQVVWAAPATRAAIVEQRHPCAPHKLEDYAPPHFRSEQDENKISQCGFELVNLLYASPQVISISRYSGQSEDCEERGGRYQFDFKVRNFDSDEALSFGTLLGLDAHRAYLRALPRHAVGDNGENCGEPDQTTDTGWRIAHARGRWRPYVNQSLGFFGCAIDAAVNFALPASLTGDASLSLDWKVLQSKLSPSNPGDVADGYVSPNGDLLIASSPSENKIFELRAGVPGKLFLTLPQGKIVMAQWATGRHVQEWTEKLGELAHQQRPAPVVQAKPPSR